MASGWKKGAITGIGATSADGKRKKVAEGKWVPIAQGKKAVKKQDKKAKRAVKEAESCNIISIAEDKIGDDTLRIYKGE